MHLHLALMPILAIIAGILILIFPKVFHYIVALFLIIVGLFELLGFNHFFFR